MDTRGYLYYNYIFGNRGKDYMSFYTLGYSGGIISNTKAHFYYNLNNKGWTELPFGSTEANIRFSHVNIKSLEFKITLDENCVNGYAYMEVIYPEGYGIEVSQSTAGSTETGYGPGEFSGVVAVDYGVAQNPGYTVSIATYTDGRPDWTIYYSLDNGVNWVEITQTGTISTDATQIKFKANCLGGTPMSCAIKSVTLGLDFNQSGTNAGEYGTSNYTLSSNVTDLYVSGMD